MKTLSRLLDVARVGVGAGVFAAAGRTPPFAYQAMIRLFCATGGLSNDVLSSVAGLFNRRVELDWRDGVLALDSESGFSDVQHALHTSGYHVFRQRLPDAICDRLLQFALDAPSTIRADDLIATSAAGSVRPYREERGRPSGVRYDIEDSVLLGNDDIQDLLGDPSILAVAQAYLGSAPRADVLSMWWHTAHSDRPSEAAAQFYHFDMDRIRWLKFFIYLTDVGPDNGPHAFVKGSHRTGGIPRALLARGYARLTDEEVLQHYRSEDIIAFTAPRGTILAEDTRGLHKGSHVLSGDRLILQLQFSNSLFGGQYPKVVLPNQLTPVLRRALTLQRDIYSNFL